MLHFEGDPPKKRDYAYSVGDLRNMILALNNNNPNANYHCKVAVNQERMALFLKNIEYWGRFIKEERDIGVYLDFRRGGGTISVYLRETDFGGAELIRFAQSLDDATCLSLVPRDDEELVINISMIDLFQKRKA